jgi:hypothetical protein
MLGKGRNTKFDEMKVTGKKMSNRAGATPLFRLSAAQKYVGSLPPWGTANRACFFANTEISKTTTHVTTGGTKMPIVKKASRIVTREVRLEEPVNELLEDYARFIESNTDHVLNAVLKKVLWRDQDYRKWREARRATQSGADKVQPATDGRGRI